MIAGIKRREGGVRQASRSLMKQLKMVGIGTLPRISLKDVLVYSTTFTFKI